MEPFKTITLDIAGLGIILYSPFAVSHISEGEDYLSSNYLEAEDVLRHVKKGSLVGFGTGSPGTYLIKIFRGCPDHQILAAYEWQLILGIEVRDGLVCVKDLYELMSWMAECPPTQTIDLENGWYRIILCSKEPASGIVGDDQTILMFFEEVASMPELTFTGIPELLVLPEEEAS